MRDLQLEEFGIDSKDHPFIDSPLYCNVEGEEDGDDDDDEVEDLGDEEDDDSGDEEDEDEGVDD